MLEIDEGGGDEERNEDPVNERDLPGKDEPDGEEEERGQELDREIAKGDPAPAVGAFPAQRRAS